MFGECHNSRVDLYEDTGCLYGLKHGSYCKKIQNKAKIHSKKIARRRIFFEAEAGVIQYVPISGADRDHT